MDTGEGSLGACYRGATLPCDMDYDVLKFIIHTQGQPTDYVIDSWMGTAYYFVKDNCSK